MIQTCLHKPFYVLALIALLSVSAAASIPDRFQMSHDIRIEPGDKSGDVTCIGCSIYVRGEIAGDVFAMHGNVVVEDGGKIAGDVSTLLGSVRLESGAQVVGSVAAIGGAVRRQPQAVLAGDVASLDGMQWVVLIGLVPIAILAAVIAFIIWLIQRTRRPARAIA